MYFGLMISLNASTSSSSVIVAISKDKPAPLSLILSAEESWSSKTGNEIMGTP